jgi:small subunit ribosomal protein S8
MMTDPIADMLTRIRNAMKARFDKVEIPSSGVKVNIARILKDEGYIQSYQVAQDGKQGVLEISLKYGEKGQPAITELIRLSKPSRRVYVNKGNVPKIRNGMGVAFISTSKGIVTDAVARQQGVGGELLCSVW